MPSGIPKLLTINGVSKSILDWSNTTGARSYNVIRERVRCGWDHEKAVFAPTKPNTLGNKLGAKEEIEKVIIAKYEFQYPIKLTALNKSWEQITKYPITPLSQDWVKNQV